MKRKPRGLNTSCVLAAPTSPAALMDERAMRVASEAGEMDAYSLVEFTPRALEAAGAGVLDEQVMYRVAGAEETLPSVPVTYDVRKKTWILWEDYSYVYQGNRLTAKKGYAFDLSSVPRALWWLIAPNELSIVAPLFHDLLYEFRGRLPDESYVKPYRTFTRLEADDLFLHLLEVEGVSAWRRYAAYSAVRAAGGLYWNT